VFGGLVFSRSLFSGQAILLSFFAFLLFCLASSGCYLFNDWMDLEGDRQHPLKKHRPVAAGELQAQYAILFALGLWLSALVLTWWLAPSLLLTLTLYIGICLGYCLGLKRWAGVDLLALAAGYVLRATGGAIVLGVPPSRWLILCTFLLALLVGAGKRRQELSILQGNASNHRNSLRHYRLGFLDLFMQGAGAAAVAAFLLYSLLSPLLNPAERIGMLLSVPLVAMGVFRFIYLVQRQGKGGDPARLFLEDRFMQWNGILWAAIICVSVYWF
jgi:4-hydroxybenzoate polyprenyltransferase